jgi:imidazolonepropionase-like amidohydrolase
MPHRMLPLAVVLLSTSFSPSLACAATGSDEKPVAIVHAVVIDGNGAAPIEDGVVIIRGARIQAVGTPGQVDLPSDATIIDAGGKAAMPGLADMHVHLVGGWDGYSVDMLGFTRYLNALLYAGVTTVLDTANVQPYVLQMRQEVAAGRLAGPRIYCTGALFDGADPIWPPISYVVTSVAQVPGMVKRQKDDGVDAIKAYFGLSTAVVAAVCREAEKARLPVFVDQGNRNGSVELARAGITGFAHLPIIPVTDSMLSVYKEKPIRCISTLAVFESFSRRRLANLSFLDNSLIRDTSPSWFIEQLRNEVHRELSPDEIARQVSFADHLREAQSNAKKLLDAGIILAAGTDAPYPGVTQGEGLHRELELLVEGGFSPLQAITAATKNAALLVDAGAEWGTLEKDKLADVLIVDGRPDRRIADTRNVSLLIQNGKIVERQRLKFDPARDPGYRTFDKSVHAGK